MIRQAVILVGLVCLVLLLAACGTAAQTTTKEDHLGRYAAEAAVAKGQAIDPAVRQAILSEPALRFPARIGLARLETGTVSPVPQSEAEAWLAMVQELGPGWGELVPISPLEVALADPTGDDPADCAEAGQVARAAQAARGAASRCEAADISTTLRGIRRSAADQQLDAVLIYEVFAGTTQTPSPLVIAKLALVDDLLASSAADRPDDQAQGVLMDVRNGAIYGFATGSGDAGGSRSRADAAITDLAKETGMMLRDLRIELAEARAARAEAGY
jgi:hypothetical protein